MTFQQFVLKGKDILADIKQVLPFISAEKKATIATKQKINARTAVRTVLLPDGNEFLTFGDGTTRLVEYNSVFMRARKFGSPNVMPISYGPGHQPDEAPEGVNDLQGVGYSGPQRGVKLTDDEIAEYHATQHRPGKPHGDTNQLDGVHFTDSPFGGRGTKIE